MQQIPQKRKRPEGGYMKCVSETTLEDLMVKYIRTRKEAEEIINATIECGYSRSEGIAYLHSCGIYLSRLI